MLVVVLGGLSAGEIRHQSKMISFCSLISHIAHFKSCGTACVESVTTFLNRSRAALQKLECDRLVAHWFEGSKQEAEIAWFTLNSR